MLIQGQLPNHFKRPKGISKLHQLIVALEENMPGLHIPVQSCQFLYFPFLDWEDKLHVRNNLDAKIRLPWKSGNSVLVNDKFQTPRWSSHIAKSIEEGDYIISHLHFPNSHEAQYSGFFLIMQAHHNNNQYQLSVAKCRGWYLHGGPWVGNTLPRDIQINLVYSGEKKIGTCFIAIWNNNNISREKTQKKEEEKQKQLDKREK